MGRMRGLAVMTNPFTYGNPISQPARFFGREREVAQIFSRLRNVEFESSSLVGERRIGKTSLLNYLAHPEVRASYALSPDTYIFVNLDLQMVDERVTPARLWQWLLNQLARKCQSSIVVGVLDGIRDAEQIDTFALADLFDTIDGNGQYVVFLLDEFENITSNPNFGPDFFYGLRSLAIHHNLALITSSRRELIELCHSDSIRSSPFFNIFANINVGLFTDNESWGLISTSLAESGIAYTEDELAAMYRMAGNHPFFLQSACHFLFEAYATNLSAEGRATFLSKAFHEEAAPHLDDFWHGSDDDEKIVLTSLALLDRQGRAGEHTFRAGQLRDLYLRSDQTLARLERRGLVVVRDDTYTLFGTSFADWITGEITDTLGARQSYDEWLEMNRSAYERLPARAKSELGQILPKISGKYRELVISWITDPRNMVAVAELLRGALSLN